MKLFGVKNAGLEGFKKMSSLPPSPLQRESLPLRIFRPARSEGEHPFRGWACGGNKIIFLNPYPNANNHINNFE